MTRAAAPRRPIEEASAPPPAKIPKGYLERSELPLASLAFLLPLMVFYELGTRYLASQAGVEHRIIAFSLLQQFFSLVGATGRHLPALSVVGILLTWHIARNDPWRLHLPTLGGMALESILLGIPLIAVGLVLARFLPLSGSQFVTPGWISSVGAGIYEELVFRLVGFTVLNLVLKDLLGYSQRTTMLLMVFISAILFSAYHYLGNETFSLRTFAFRALAGVYFGVLFLFRGFGITAGSHASYDVLIALLRRLTLP
jgi:hypothetical protein